MIVKQRLEHFDVTIYVASAVDKISRIHMNNIDMKISRAVIPSEKRQFHHPRQSKGP